jgi:hypothetical protein
MEQTANTIIERAVRVARLDLPIYRTIARDPNATREAAIVVGVVALAAGIGSLRDSAGSVLLAIVGAFLGWFIFSFMTYFFGRNIFGTPTTQVNVESLLRTQGYARIPNILTFFGFIPFLGWIPVVIGSIWSLITAIIAIRETLAISTGRAILVAIVAAIASGLVIAILALIFNVSRVTLI